jgi:GntR family transcriptional regulator, carbon starvation induced regulator
VKEPLSSRSEWAARRLRNAILTGELPPGAVIQANALAAEWLISPTPVREAFQRLAADGHLIHRAHRGVRVAPISLREMEELYELRLFLEPMALDRSLVHADVGWHRSVEEAFVALQEMLHSEPGDIVSYEDVHRRFHAELIAGAGSQWLLRVVGQLRDNSERYRALSWKRRGGAAGVAREHEEIYRAALALDRPQAVELLRLHMCRTRDAVRAELASRPELGPTDEEAA